MPHCFIVSNVVFAVFDKDFTLYIIKNVLHLKSFKLNKKNRKFEIKHFLGATLSIVQLRKLGNKWLINSMFIPNPYKIF